MNLKPDNSQRKNARRLLTWPAVVLATMALTFVTPSAASAATARPFTPVAAAHVTILCGRFNWYVLSSSYTGQAPQYVTQDPGSSNRWTVALDSNYPNGQTVSFSAVCKANYGNYYYYPTTGDFVVTTGQSYRKVI